jgi:hypothetical protein
MLLADYVTKSKNIFNKVKTVFWTFTRGGFMYESLIGRTKQNRSTTPCISSRIEARSLLKAPGFYDHQSVVD